jgi:hypothetical protein
LGVCGALDVEAGSFWSGVDWSCATAVVTAKTANSAQIPTSFVICIKIFS